MLENPRIGAQIDYALHRFVVLDQILAREELFGRQGTVDQTWRFSRGRRFGPYYRLVYREGGHRRSIYLGRCAILAREVRSLLAFLQRPLRKERKWKRVRRAVKSSLRAQKAEWARELAKHGLWLKGYEVRRRQSRSPQPKGSGFRNSG